ncbi:hypothetical protein IscW_ISCW004099 [Ixodes scapularis]|uniref:Uncharacterized protein n=1 Tax=Ixodes scapularis TaxID=6945 RepID=B7PGF7_IXOSC|nr:hypothetical protein IscW_ISCW004099 [Ixodes scapularis]|eukprot:XP_002434279.1 hypothetical protein IscW_ISCW004099 [Ixodes scapularis]
MVVEKHAASRSTFPPFPTGEQASQDDDKHTEVLNLRSFGILMVIISLLVISSALFFTSFDPIYTPGLSTDTLPLSLVEEDNLKTERTRNLPVVTRDDSKKAIYETINNQDAPVVASDDATEAFPETIINQDEPDVNLHQSWRTVNADNAGGSASNQCTRPQCKWLSKFLNSKLDWTIKPCHDFYSHVCSAKWFGPSEENVDSLDFGSQKVARETAQGIAKLEMALRKITSREFVSLADRVFRVTHMATGDKSWDFLLHVLTYGRTQVRTLDFKYTSNLMEVLRNTSSALDAANFIIFSALLQISPLIQNMSSLIPLGMDETVKGVPLQVQGCLRLTEKAYQRGMRILALMALSLKDWSPERPKAAAMVGLIRDLKESLTKYVKVWFSDKQSRKRALRRLQTLKINLLGATPHDEIVYARAEKPVKDARQIVSILEGSTTRDISKDSFFPGSIFSTSPMYIAETHTLYLPSGFLGLVNNLTEISDPLYLPLIGAPILKAIMAVVDARGAQIFSDRSGITTHWWTPAEDLKYATKAACFRNLYSLALKELLISTHQEVFVDEFVAQGAILEPLYRVFKNRMAHYYPDGLRMDPEFTADMLYFIVYAMGYCEISGLEKVKVKHRIGIPSRILVNAHLGNNKSLDGHQEADGCTGMHGRVLVQSLTSLPLAWWIALRITAVEATKDRRLGGQ